MLRKHKAGRSAAPSQPGCRRPHASGRATFALFMTSLYGLYFTPVFDYLMGTWWGHNLMLVHFLLIGFIYFWGIIGVDPSPQIPGRAGG